MFQILLIGLFSTLALLASNEAFAVSACRSVHRPTHNGFHQDPIEQLMLWEETTNTSRWAKPTSMQSLSVVRAPMESVVINSTQKPGSIQEMFQSSKGIAWPKHPWNLDHNVPYFNGRPVETWKARFSASRSMFIYSPKNELYSIKMPTNNPHNSIDHLQKEKANLAEDASIAIARSNLIERTLSQKKKKNPKVVILPDVLTVVDKVSKNGIVVRDLRQLQTGNYYLPAFSIPYVGREIAKHLNVPFEHLWGVHYAEILGQAKAMLLINFGLHMVTPNAQNFLIELTPDLNPTGRIFIRDIADSSFVVPIAESLGLKHEIERDKQNGVRTLENPIDVEGKWDSSSWQMDEGGISDTTLSQWYLFHNRAYTNYVVKELSSTPTGSQLFAGYQETWGIFAIIDRLMSDKGGEALKEHQQLQSH